MHVRKGSGFWAIDEDGLFNADATHFVVDLNDARTLAMKFDKDVKFSDVLSGDTSMTMMFLLGGSSKSHLGVRL